MHRGWGGNSSGLDANYPPPPPTNRWPEVPRGGVRRSHMLVLVCICSNVRKFKSKGLSHTIAMVQSLLCGCLPAWHDRRSSASPCLRLTVDQAPPMLEIGSGRVLEVNVRGKL